MMTDEQAYTAWLAHGGDAVGLGVTRKALAFAAAEPTAALRLRTLHEQARREAERVELYESTALLHGASPEDARADALAHIEAERQERISEDVSDAHRSAYQRTRQTF